MCDTHTWKEEVCAQVTSPDLDRARCNVSSAWERCFPPAPIWAALRVPESHYGTKEKGDLKIFVVTHMKDWLGISQTCS